MRLPIEKPISILAANTSTVPTAIISGKRDPFLYNPRKAAAGQVMRFCRNDCNSSDVNREVQTKTVLVQNESFDLVVTLRNPYVFDLDLQSLQLRFVSTPKYSRSYQLTSLCS